MDKQAYFKMMGLDKQAAIDPQVIKNILLGTGAGLGTYALSSFLPGARQNRLARLLASLGVGLGTGYFGTDIRNWFSNSPDKNQDTSDPTIDQDNAQAQQLVMQQAVREQLERQQAAKASASKTPATKAATPTIEQENAQAQQLAMQQAKREQLERQQAAKASATKTTAQATKTAPAAAAPKTAPKAAAPAAAPTAQATKTTPNAAPTKDPYQAALDQEVAETMRNVQFLLAKNPIRYMNYNPVKVRQSVYKWERASRDARNANRGYPYKINPTSLGRTVYTQAFYPEIDKDEHEALYGPLPRGVVNFMDNQGGRDL